MAKPIEKSMMTKKLFLLYVIFGLIGCAAQQVPLYVGTYTGKGSEGIYQYHFNVETGSLVGKKLAAKAENPSFLAYGPEKKRLYAVNENNDFQGSQSGAVSAFKIQKDGMLQLLNVVSSNGAHPCHISLNKAGDKAVVSNYTGGSVALYNISGDGEID